MHIATVTEHFHRFMDIAAFFGLMVWLVPFMFFISLSASENTLPAFGAFFFWFGLVWFGCCREVESCLKIRPAVVVFAWKENESCQGLC